MQADAKETITWLFVELPGVYDAKDGHLVGGADGDRLLNLFTLMPEYEHVTQSGSVARVLREMTTENHYCSMPMRKTEARARQMLFTVPAGLALGVRVILRPSTYNELARPVALSLNALVARESLLGVVIAGRSYSPAIDQTLGQLMPNSHVRSISQSYDIALTMLSMGRADYLLENPGLLRTWERQQPNPAAPEQAFVSVPISGTNDYELAYFSCTKTAWSEPVVARLNEVIKRQVRDPNYHDSATRYLSKSELAAYQTYWQKHVIGAMP